MYEQTVLRKVRMSVMFSVFLLLAHVIMQTPSLAETTLRIGHFPNITHVQVLVAQNMSRNGKG